MLTRLRVNGFKNLRNVDLHFGPFTCIAGRNGVGKSNLFDAITFLSDLATMPVMQAALRVRGTNGRIADLASLFTRGRTDGISAIEFIAEMIVSRTVLDDFDRPARPAATFVEYTLELRLNQRNIGAGTKDPIYVEREELRAKSSSDAGKALPFGPEQAWKKRYIEGPGKRTAPFIETRAAKDTDQSIIVLKGEVQRGDPDKRTGRPPEVPARKSPQTVLSGVNTVSHATALATRREMQSWRLLQLEPSALRRPDEFRSDPHLSAVGEHLPATLNRLRGNVEITERLSELIPGILSVDVNADTVRESLTVMVKMKDSLDYSASSLSDGTLRFLALSVLASDPEASGVICMEEPENGIHPLRIPEMLDLVRSLAGLDEEGVSPVQAIDASLRQVIINTHSPLVVNELAPDDLLMAQAVRIKGAEFVDFRPLWNTWRARAGNVRPTELVTRGELLGYLQGSFSPRRRREPKRIADVVTEVQQQTELQFSGS